MTKTRAITFVMTDDQRGLLRKSGAAHKYDYGHAAVISGQAGQGGAARLAARGALRIGAGLVSVVCPIEAQAEHAAQLNAIMVKPYAEVTDFKPFIRALKPQAICIGPNLGVTTTGNALLTHVFNTGLPVCLDADAITLMGKRDTDLSHVKNADAVMTPHSGELRRFVPDAFNTTTCRVTLAQRAADKAGCVVLFKGSDTIIAATGRLPVQVSSKGHPHASWLATAGSGDVLAGFVVGLLARGFDGFDAACIAAELHLLCADAVGPGLIAEDIPEILPSVMALM